MVGFWKGGGWGGHERGIYRVVWAWGARNLGIDSFECLEDGLKKLKKNTFPVYFWV